MNPEIKINLYWQGMAARYEASLAPLRLSTSERDIYIELAAKWHTNGQPPRVLVLGATADFYHLPWPEHTDLMAVDRSQPMLAEVWPGDQSQTLCQDWAAMDLPDASRDIVLCDGGLSFFSYPDALQKLANNVVRIMAPGGLFIVRLYVDGDYQETPQDIFQQLEAGAIRNSSELKLRLWFALHQRDGKGVCVADVWSCFNAAYPEEQEFISKLAWPAAEWQSMQAYKGMNDVYRFPSVAQVTEVFAQSKHPLHCEAEITPAGPCHQHLRILALRRSS